ncbi:hypothetical protein, partial [Nocardia sp. 852002-20019_SCH5090214]|uniref:hypothetical protein n=1 Tax=Nocardia sp. 852002-20019_SCH5090214 TaxID=1834087 RepID=UPI000B03B308
GTLERRIQLADNEAIMYGPAPGTTSTPTAVDTEWLEQELTELHAELTRRSGLTVEQAGAEETRRAHDTHHSKNWSTSEQPSFGTGAAAEADGPQL